MIVPVGCEVSMEDMKGNRISEEIGWNMEEDVKRIQEACTENSLVKEK